MVDDALINTDIDKVIAVLSSQKRIELEQLSKETGVAIQTLRNWLHTLEEEGYVRIEYKLTKIYIVWLLDTPATEKTTHEVESDIERDMKMHKEEEKIKEKPHAPVINHTDKKREKQKMEEAEAGTELEELSQEEKELLEPAEEISVEEAKKEKPKSIEAKNSVKGKKKHVVSTKKTIKYDEMKSRLKEIFSEVNSMKAELEDLEVEKRKKFRETMERADKIAEITFDKITDKTLQIEEHILGLKEQLMELTKTGEVSEKALDKISEAKQEALSTIGELEESLESLKSDINNESSGVVAALEESVKSFDKQKKNIITIEEEMEENSKKEEELSSMLEGMKDTMKNLESKMTEQDRKLLELRNKKADLIQDITKAKGYISKKEDDITKLKEKLDSFRGIEKVVTDYIENYRKMADSIEDKVKQAEIEAIELRKAAEVEALIRYLDELDTMATEVDEISEKYEKEEQNINDRIDETKDRIRMLIKESKDLAKLLRDKESNNKGYKEKREESEKRLEDIEDLVNKGKEK